MLLIEKVFPTGTETSITDPNLYGEPDLTSDGDTTIELTRTASAALGLETVVFEFSLLVTVPPAIAGKSVVTEPKDAPEPMAIFPPSTLNVSAPTVRSALGLVLPIPTFPLLRTVTASVPPASPTSARSAVAPAAPVPDVPCSVSSSVAPVPPMSVWPPAIPAERGTPGTAVVPMTPSTAAIASRSLSCISGCVGVEAPKPCTVGESGMVSSAVGKVDAIVRYSS